MAGMGIMLEVELGMDTYIPQRRQTRVQESGR